MSHDVFAKTISLEDVLVSTVFGALAYGPPAMLGAWRRRFSTMPPLSADVQFEFWPNHSDGGRWRSPDVLILDRVRGEAVVVEAKRGLPNPEALSRQLIDEGLAARATLHGVRLHLLVVSDQQAEPAAFHTVRRLRPRLYASRMRHASWTDLCAFFRAWSLRPDCDSGHRRMIEDALSVMAKYRRASRRTPLQR